MPLTSPVLVDIPQTLQWASSRLQVVEACVNMPEGTKSKTLFDAEEKALFAYIEVRDLWDKLRLTWGNKVFSVLALQDMPLDIVVRLEKASCFLQSSWGGNPLSASQKATRVKKVVEALRALADAIEFEDTLLSTKPEYWCIQDYITETMVGNFRVTKLGPHSEEDYKFFLEGVGEASRLLELRGLGWFSNRVLMARRVFPMQWMGMYSYSNSSIVLNPKLFRGDSEKLVNILLHEVGHGFRDKYLLESTGETLFQHLKNHKVGFVSNYAKTDAEENFADMFSDYVRGVLSPKHEELFKHVLSKARKATPVQWIEEF